MGCDAVYQGRIEDTGAASGAVNQGRAVGGSNTGHAEQDLRALLDDAGERNADGVDEGARRPIAFGGRDVVESDRVDAFSNLPGQRGHRRVPWVLLAGNYREADGRLAILFIGAVDKTSEGHEIFDLRLHAAVDGGVGGARYRSQSSP